MVTRKNLNRRHNVWDAERTERYRAMYEGGDRFRARLREFLPQQPFEPIEQYRLRRQISTYRNYFGPIVDYFGALLFASAPIIQAKRKGSDEIEVELPEYYSAFEKDCDRTGTNIIDALKEALSDACVVKRSWIWVQHARDGAELARTSSLADFEKLKAGDSWIRVLKDESVFDWECDDQGNLEWVMVFAEKTKRLSIASERDQVVETWHHIQKDRVDVYQLSYKKSDPPADDAEVPLVDSYEHRYKVVPVVCLDLPPALWVGERMESPQLAHYRLTNMQLWGMSRSCYAMPVFKRDSEEATPPTMGAGYGIYIGIKESLEWAAPPVDCYTALGEAIKEHKDEIYRITNTMALGVENNSAAVGRSAESKTADARSTVVVMLAFARRVRETIERLYDLIARARSDDLVWDISGLDDFNAEDLPGVVEMFSLIEAAGGIPSKTFNVEMKAKLAESFLPDLTQEKKMKIREELEGGVLTADEEFEREVEQQHTLAVTLAGTGANAGTSKRGAGTPSGAKPKAPARGGSGGASPPSTAKKTRN